MPCDGVSRIPKLQQQTGSRFGVEVMHNDGRTGNEWKGASGSDPFQDVRPFRKRNRSRNLSGGRSTFRQVFGCSARTASLPILSQQRVRKGKTQRHRGHRKNASQNWIMTSIGG
jgi:hypothetical protein